jgi:murein DD-endopeptidase MepM/ murein hydrolase activator NlpD
MSFRLAIGLCCLLVQSVSQTLGAQDLRITWTPERPVQGTMFRIRVEGATDSTRLSGSAANELLHFSKRGRAYEAIAAAPLDGDSALNVTVNERRVTIPIAKGTYTLEKLTVAPRFGTPPDSATRARMDREREKALAVSRASHSTPRLWQTVQKPRDSRVTSTFGSGREFNGQIQSRHTGTDLAGTVGAPVRAAALGIVALVDTFYLAGRVIYIDHGEGVVSAYFHLSRQDVAVGDTVTAGQQIGLVGATGRVTGPHLHWVVRYGAISVDPMSFLAIAER